MVTMWCVSLVFIIRLRDVLINGITTFSPPALLVVQFVMRIVVVVMMMVVVIVVMALPVATISEFHQ